MRYLLYSLAVACALNNVAWSQTPVGGEFQVNTHTTGDQYGPRVASAANGDFVVVWTDFGGNDGDGWGIFAQRYDRAGSPLEPVFQPNAYTTGDQVDAFVDVADNGDFVVVWIDLGGYTDVFAQRFSSDGSPLGGRFQVNSYTTGEQDSPSVAVGGAGDFVVFWDSYGQDGDSLGVFGQMFGADGAKRGSEFQVNSYTTSYQYRPMASFSSSSGFVVVWSGDGQDGDRSGVFGRRYDSDGTALGGDFQVNSYTTGNQRLASVAVDSDGSFVVAWDSVFQDGSQRGIFARRYSPSGSPLGTAFQVNTFTTAHQSVPALAMDGDGDFVITWNSQLNNQDGSGSGIFGQQYSSDGSPVGAEFQINTYTTNNQIAASVAMEPDGDFVVVWRSQDQDGDGRGIFGQVFDGAGFVGTSPTHGLSINQTLFSTGDWLRVSVEVVNPGSSLTAPLVSAVDYYMGVLLPDGETIVFFTDLTFQFDRGALSDVSTLRPILSGVDLTMPFVENLSNFFSYQWTAADPAGRYTMFLAAVLPGGFTDGSVDLGDIVAIATADFTFNP